MQSFVGALSAYFGHGLWNVFVGALDIMVVAVLVYRLLLLIRGTRAMQMGMGLALVFVAYELARRIGLLTLYSLLDGLLDVDGADRGGDLPGRHPSRADALRWPRLVDAGLQRQGHLGASKRS